MRTDFSQNYCALDEGSGCGTICSGACVPLTVLGVSYPDGTQTQRTGVRIDIAVLNTAGDYMQGRDALLERAIQYIDTGR